MAAFDAVGMDATGASGTTASTAGNAPGSNVTGTGTVSGGAATASNGAVNASAPGSAPIGTGSVSGGTGSGTANAPGSAVIGTGSVSGGAATATSNGVTAPGSSVSGPGSVSGGSGSGTASAPGSNTSGTGTVSGGGASQYIPPLVVNPTMFYARPGIGWNFPDMIAGDIDNLSYEFKTVLGAGVTIVSVEPSVLVHSGIDPDPESIVIDGPTIDGSIVTIQVQPTLAGVSYWPRVSATLSDGEKVTLPLHGEGSLTVDL